MTQPHNVKVYTLPETLEGYKGNAEYYHTLWQDLLVAAYQAHSQYNFYQGMAEQYHAHSINKEQSEKQDLRVRREAIHESDSSKEIV